MKTKLKETDIGDRIVDYFKGPAHEVFCEVPCLGIIDVVVKCGSIITAIECKTTFGLSVIEQAVKNKNYAHYSYVAVPKATGHFAKRICHEYGIGILVVPISDNGDIIEHLKPKLNRRIVVPKLPEFCKYNRAGVQSDRWTAYSWFVDNMKNQLRRHPEGLSHKDLFDSCIRHYNTASSMKSCLQTYIRLGVLTDVVYRDNRFHLSH